MDRKLREKQIYYGLAVLLSVFVIVGLTQALTAKEKDTEVVKEEKIIEEDQKQELIRVLIMTDGYSYIVHPEVEVCASSGMTVSFGEETEEIEADELLQIAPDDVRFEKGNIRICAKEGKLSLQSITRGYGTPSYDGVLELQSTAEGIVIINELSVESYLCGVVPSEMPSSYELEALKAQAVCARSYAYRQMESFAYPEYEAHVNDFTVDQGYGNFEPSEHR